MLNKLRTKIKKEAILFVNQNKLASKKLDFSIESLNIVENIIETNIEQLQNDTSEVDKVASYMLETFIENYPKGKIVTENNRPLFIFDDNNHLGETIDVYDYTYSRVLYKLNNQQNYSF